MARWAAGQLLTLNLIRGPTRHNITRYAALATCRVFEVDTYVGGRSVLPTLPQICGVMWSTKGASAKFYFTLY